MPVRRQKRRPALWTALALAVGILIADRLQPPIQVWLGALATLMPLTVWRLVRPGFRPARTQGPASRTDARATGCLLALAAVAGGLRYHQHTRLLPPHHIARVAALGQRGVLAGRLTGEPEVREEADEPGGEARTRLVLAAESWDPEDGDPRPLTGRVWVTLRGFAIAADAGDRLWLRTRLIRPPPARNPGAFDFRRFLALQGVYATASVYRPEQLLRVESLPTAWWRERLVLPLRGAIRDALEANLSGAPAGLARGILLGEKHRIPIEVAERFRHTGLAHALVISGLHVGLVGLFFFTLFRLLRASPRRACLATTAVLVVYAFVTDLQAPVVRSSIMAGVVLVGRASGRRGEVYNCLGLAALAILALWPASLLTLSFQLSFGATLAIVGLHGSLMSLFPRAWRDEERLLGRWVLAPVCVTVAAQLGTGPLMAYHFQQFAPVSLVANLAVVPLLGAAVALGLLAALTGPWLPVAGTLFNGANYLVLTGLLDVVEAFAEVPLASLTTPRPAVHSLVLAAAAAWLLAQARWQRQARVWLLLVVLVWADVAVWSRVLGGRGLEVVFLDVGQGDGAFLRFPNGRTMLVDGGVRSRRTDAGERVVVPFLRRLGVRRVDVVVASHPHADHIGGLVRVLESVEVGHYVDAGQSGDSWTARRLRELIAQRGVEYHRVAAGDSLVGLGGVGALVLHPTEAFVAADGSSPFGLNDGSVVVRFDYGGTRLLFTGDVEQEADAALLGWGERLRAEVLKAAHHGSRTSSRPRFVDGVDPLLCVVSVGTFNKFGHPAPEVLARYRERGTWVYRTDECGAVTLRVGADGAREVEVMMGCRPAARPPRPAAAPVVGFRPAPPGGRVRTWRGRRVSGG